MHVRMWFLPDGTVRQTSFAPGMTLQDIAEETTRLARRFPGAVWHDMDHTDLPPRTGRHRWRHENGRVMEDLTIPALVDPRQALRDEVASATTIAALKAALLKVLG